MHKQAVMILAALVIWLGLVGGAHAGTTVRVLETWPSGDNVTLGRNQHFYLRLAYDTDRPAGIWATPYFHGKPVNAGSNPSQTYSGSGETYGWFFLMQPGDEVDEIRIKAGDGSHSGTPVVASWHGHIVGGREEVATQAQPAWVVETGAHVQAAQDQAYKAYRGKPVSVGDMALFSGFMLAMFALGAAGFAAPAWGLWRWRGGWRIAAIVPAAVMSFVVLRIMSDVSRDPTAHNLWPLEILQAGVFSVVAMVVLAVVRKLSSAHGGMDENGTGMP